MIFDKQKLLPYDIITPNVSIQKRKEKVRNALDYRSQSLSAIHPSSHSDVRLEPKQAYADEQDEFIDSKLLD